MDVSVRLKSLADLVTANPRCVVVFGWMGALSQPPITLTHDCRAHADRDDYVYTTEDTVETGSNGGESGGGGDGGGGGGGGGKKVQDAVFPVGFEAQRSSAFLHAHRRLCFCTAPRREWTRVAPNLLPARHVPAAGIDPTVCNGTHWVDAALRRDERYREIEQAEDD